MFVDFIEFKKVFNEVKKKGWVKSLRKGDTGVGYTFETLIGKEEENFPIADYGSIEIKTTRMYSKKRIHLFSAVPDGDYLFPIKRVLDKLGYPDKERPEYKVFQMGFNGKDFSNIGYYKKGKIVVNHKEKKIDFVVINSYNKNIDINVSWSFQLLYERLYLKLKKLAYIKADRKFINGDEYFYYRSIKMYKLKSFSTFLSLIENGVIEIRFSIGVFKSGKRESQVHDRGTVFSINEENITKLFDEIRI